MVSFEQAFSDAERAADSALKSAADLMRQVRALKKAAQTGNIAAVKRSQDRLDEALGALRQEVVNAISSWPFDDDDEKQYLNDHYADELRHAAEELGLDIHERDGRLISHPSIVRILPGECAVRVDRKKVSNIRPSHLADFLLANQNKSSGFRPNRFLESLYTVYSDIVSGESSGRMVEGPSLVVPLVRIYKLLTSLPGASREYDRSDFARDLYILDANGPHRTRRGALVSFHASTGAKSDRDLFSFIGPDGQSVVYYGIRFTEGD